MSLIEPCCPSFMIWVSGLTRSFLLESDSVSSFESLSNFWTVPVSSLLVLALDPIAPVDDDEPVPPVSELVELDPVPYFELDPVSVEGEVELLLPDDPPVVPDCACTGCAATSSPAIPRLAAVPHPKYLIESSPWFVLGFRWEPG